MDTTNPRLRPVPAGKVRLLDSIFSQRFDLNSRYVTSLQDEGLLQNHYIEAGLRRPIIGEVNELGAMEQTTPQFNGHAGWEFPTCQVRGQFLGHWISAAARIYEQTGNTLFKARVDHIVNELARCQERNGGEWCFSIPQKYLEWAAIGTRVWAPQYVAHKTLMGLFDAYRHAGNEQALDIMARSAEWFHRWTGQFDREGLDRLFNSETGGMLEVWADLYGATGDPKHLALMQRYDRRDLFDKLLAGEDVLTNRHANTTIPEAHGAARAWEVTGDQRWRDIAEAYWRLAVTERGHFCTGGQTCGEVWTPPFAFSARLGEKTQEHCTTYNMMRLADYLLRWTGDTVYADYWERNLYNGTLAQQHPKTGMVTYFLPLRAGSVKWWGTPTRTFWCCHGTLVQAHTQYVRAAWFEDDQGLTLSQYIPTELDWQWKNTTVRARLVPPPPSSLQEVGSEHERHHRPNAAMFELSVACDEPVEFTLSLRIPEWLSGKADILVDGKPEAVADGARYHRITRRWHKNVVNLCFPKTVRTCPLPDRPDTAAFLDGPVVLAGLGDGPSLLKVKRGDAASVLIPDNEREWGQWKSGYRSAGQLQTTRFLPLYEVGDEPYTVYFTLDESTPA
jgi:DUF1680 family protein